MGRGRGVNSTHRDHFASPSGNHGKGDQGRFAEPESGTATAQVSPSADASAQDGLSSGPLSYGRLDTWYQSFSRRMSYVAAAALGVITAVCFVDVVGAKFFGWPVPSQFELVANLNLVAVFLAAFYVQMDRGSVSIELLQNHLPRPVKLAVRIFGSLLGIAVCFFAAYRGWCYLVDFIQTRKSASGVWHFPIWPFQAVLVLGFFCLGLAFLFTVGRDVHDYRGRRGRFNPRPVHVASDREGEPEAQHRTDSGASVDESKQETGES